MSIKPSALQTVGYAFLGFFFWALSDTCIKVIRVEGLSPSMLIAMMGLIGCTFLLGHTAITHKLNEIRPRNLRNQILRGFLQTGTYYFCVIALKYISLSMFYLLIFSAPLIITIMAAVFLHEKMNWQKGASILAGFIGVVIAINPFADHSDANVIGYIAMIGAVLSFSANAIWLRRMTQSETPLSITFMLNLISLVTATVVLLFTEFQSFNLQTFFWLCGASILGLIGTATNALALKHTNAAHVSQYHYSQILIGALMGYLIWGDVPTYHMFVGAAFIVASGLYMARLLAKEHR